MRRQWWDDVAAEFGGKQKIKIKVKELDKKKTWYVWLGLTDKNPILIYHKWNKE